jgi:hypothetical protein
MQIGYEGWFQCRLATDPDAFDHRRGEFGWTFAFDGEPNLDRIIRFHDPVAHRVEGPAVGVTVRSVRVDGADQTGSPLLGGKVQLIDNAVFEGKNGEIAPSAREPIVPLHIQITTPAGLRLQKFDRIDLSNFAEIVRRQPTGGQSNDPDVRAATGVTNFQSFRRDRRDRLQQLHAIESDPVAKSRLQQRIDQLEDGLDAASDIRFRILGFRLDWQHSLRDAMQADDPAGELPAAPRAGAEWSISHWMGGWDADTLCAYTRGVLTIPLSQ